MSNSETQSARVLELAEEFLERHRRGERPTLREYVDREPALADQIKSVFPAMAMMEDIAPADESLASGATDTVILPRTVGDSPPRAQLGDYRIIREVGRGGMGVVYEAEQISLGRHVALKVLLRQGMGESSHLQRFLFEARAAARLHHTNIVPVFGVGDQDGVHYYALQRSRGPCPCRPNRRTHASVKVERPLFGFIRQKRADHGSSANFRRGLSLSIAPGYDQPTSPIRA